MRIQSIPVHLLSHLSGSEAGCTGRGRLALPSPAPISVTKPGPSEDSLRQPLRPGPSVF
jgi:hypothetical protein